MSGYTPGPWSYDRQYRRLMGPDGKDLYIEGGAHWATTRDPEAEANSRLIAAAPELLEALKEVVTHWADETDENDWPEFDRARKAIAKATGKDNASKTD